VQDSGIRNLLDLAGHVLDQEDGYWIKIEAWEVPASADIPHGIRYSLTLHAPSGKRLLGYDNAHAVKTKKGRYSGRRLPFDHRHRSASDKGVAYTFKSADQMLADFFKEVDKVLKEVRAK
jgi:hypothetical protein